MAKPRDICGNDLIVSATATAMEVARAAGLENDTDLVKKLATGFYSEELKRRKIEE